MAEVIHEHDRSTTAGDRSKALFARARNLFPGGVNSPVRAFRAVGGEPLFVDRGKGPYLYDVDGRRYIDYVMSYGPLILGHADPGLIAAVTEAARHGTSFGAPTPHALRLAELIRAAIPSLEMMRFVNSGTEATMSALRLARAYTGRSKIVKFEGCYHGHSDHLLVKAGSGVATLGLPDSPGVPAGATSDTFVLPYNDAPALEGLFDSIGEQIAAVIVEPVAGNMGVVLPKAGYLEALRSLTIRHDALLIFDEVMTGFRVHPGGAQMLYGVAPDLTALGKIIGGGLPAGAYGGRREIMELIAPEGPVYQAGTLSANPVAMAAGIYTLESILQDDAWKRVAKTTATLAAAIEAAAQTDGESVTVNRAGAMLSIFFSEGAVTDWQSAAKSDSDKFKRFFRSLLAQGVYVPPSPYEGWFPSIAHGEDLVEQTIAAVRGALQAVVTGGT